MTKWRYLVYTLDYGLVAIHDEPMTVVDLNKQGEEGWELCTVLPISSSATKEQREIFDVVGDESNVTFHYIFKRPIEG